MGATHAAPSGPDRRRRALAIVASPLQLVHTAEALDVLDLDVGDTDLAILVPPDATGAAQIERVLGHERWASVTRLPGTGGLVARLRWLRADRAHLDLAAVLIGDYRRAYLREVVRRVTPGPRVVLVDDGNATLLVAAHRRNRHEGGPGLASLRLHGAPERAPRLARLVGREAPELPELTFASIYDLEVLAPDSLVRHRLARLARRGAEPRPEPRTVILGASLVETGVVSDEVYERCVERLVAEARTPVVYWPHRRERRANVDRVASRFGFTVAEPELPAELVVALTGIRPRAFCTVLSSAADTLSLLCDGSVPIRVAPPRPDTVAPRARAGVSLVVEHLRRRVGDGSIELLPDVSGSGW